MDTYDNYIVWIDERTSDFRKHNCDFEDSLNKLGIKLARCDEGDATGNLARGRRCIENCHRTLSEIHEGNIQTPLGVVLDVNIPVDDLSGFSDSYRSINTYSGSYTGFLIAQYVISSLEQGCLLYTSPSPRDKRQSRMPSSA